MIGTLLAADLQRVITEAALFAYQDETLPSINSVRFEATGIRLIAVGTDRFTLGCSSTPFESEPFSFGLRLEHARLIGQVAGPGRGGGRKLRKAELKTTPKGGEIQASFGTGEKVRVPIFTDVFPSWRKLIKDEVLDGESTSIITLNPEKLARFGRIKRDSERMTMMLAGANKVVVVRIDDDFIGLVMPIRCDQAWALPEWLPKS